MFFKNIGSHSHDSFDLRQYSGILHVQYTVYFVQVSSITYVYCMLISGTVYNSM